MLVEIWKHLKCCILWVFICDSTYLIFFLRFIIYLFLFYLFLLRRVLVAAHGIFVEACRIFLCGTRASLQLWRAGFFSLHQLWHAGSRVRGLCSCGARGPEHMGSLVCGSRALVELCELSSCGMRAQLPHGMWDLSSLTRDRTHIPCIGRWILYHWTTRKVPTYLILQYCLF